MTTDSGLTEMCSRHMQQHLRHPLVLGGQGAAQDSYVGYTEIVIVIVICNCIIVPMKVAYSYK